MPASFSAEPMQHSFAALSAVSNRASGICSSCCPLRIFSVANRPLPCPGTVWTSTCRPIRCFQLRSNTRQTVVGSKSIVRMAILAVLAGHASLPTVETPQGPSATRGRPPVICSNRHCTEEVHKPIDQHSGRQTQRLTASWLVSDQGQMGPSTL